MTTTQTMNALILLRLRRELRTDRIIDVYKIAEDLFPIMPDIALDDIASAVGSIVARRRGNAMWNRDNATASPHHGKLLLFPTRKEANTRPETGQVTAQSGMATNVSVQDRH